MVPQVLFELLELREYIRIVPARLRSDLLVQDKLPRTHAHAPAIRRQRGSASPGRSGPPVKPQPTYSLSSRFWTAAAVSADGGAPRGSTDVAAVQHLERELGPG